jgi:nucleoside-diphosphate-sugar epimerase
MRGLVTGAAGFIGSTLVDRLLLDGHRVVGVDSFTDYYDPARKRRNLSAAQAHERFELHDTDLVVADLTRMLDGIDVVFHVAGQPGLRASWGAGFADYAAANIVATQRLLEACRGVPLDRFVFSSSSSVYGHASERPLPEAAPTAPISPYGATKLAAEHLCAMYGASCGIPTIVLRYFTVYGPRQRPDMAMAKLIDAGLHGTPFALNGDGTQARDFTFVDDVVEATVAAGAAPVERVPAGTVCNIGGGAVTSLSTVAAHVARLVGRAIELDHRPRAAGEPRCTSADTTAARVLLGWTPKVGVIAGLERQITAAREG